MNAAGGVLGVGYKGNGSLTVSGGVTIAGSTGYLGYDAGSTGTAIVTGSGSKWTSSGYLYVGSSGNGSLTVSDGGKVTAGTLYASLADLYGNGTITATQGAVVDADLFFDAAHGTQATVPFGSGGTLRVNAAGGDLGVGYKGNGSLTVSEGVTISASTGRLGFDAGSTGTATVTGSGSKWTNSSELYIGFSGSGTLQIEAGGAVSNTYGYLASTSGSTGTATVTGSGSKWTNSSNLDIGLSGSGVLRIEAGGAVSSWSGYLGNGSGSTGTATVAGIGSTWANSNSLDVGYLSTGALPNRGRRRGQQRVGLPGVQFWFHGHGHHCRQRFKMDL